VKSCSQLVDTEALVLGELDAAHAGRLREHSRSCAACRAEIELLTAERALFVRRAEVMSAPPPALASAVRRQIDAERSPIRRILAPAVGRFLRRGHMTAACAAALFVVAAFSRTGSSAMAGAASLAADDETNASGMLASYRTEEPIACSLGAGPASYDDGARSAMSSSFAVSRGAVLACRASSDGARALSSLPCEPFVTCSWLRQ
jgi:anti-sigma factor RsiW